MRNNLFALFFLFALPISAQENVKLYDEMCDPLQAVFCDYVKNESQTSYISNATGEYVGTLINSMVGGFSVRQQVSSPMASTVMADCSSDCLSIAMWSGWAVMNIM